MLRQNGPNPDHAKGNREKRLVALSSLVAAIVLTSLKLGVGLWTNSLGILSEALHSGLDLVAAAMTLWAVRIAARPADREHTYGHGKFENFSALVETLLLLLTCVWIFRESFQRLFGREEVIVDANLWAFLTVSISIVIDFTRSRALGRVAKKYQSQALEADALHFSTDIWSSAVVLLGLAGVLAADHFGLPWLHKADAAAALIVALIVVGVSLNLGKRAINDLLDTVPRDLQKKVETAVRVNGVRQVRQARIRRSGPEFFADVILSIEPDASFERSHRIADEAEKAVRELLPNSDITVHVEPENDEKEGVPLDIRRLAQCHGLDAHGIQILRYQGGTSIELHLEVAADLSVAKAHDQATAFENELLGGYPDCDRVITHLEPAGKHGQLHLVDADSLPLLERLVEEYLKELDYPCRPHDMKIRDLGGEYNLSFHCSVAPDTKITEAHELTEKLEHHLRSRVPELRQVSIHVEPED